MPAGNPLYDFTIGMALDQRAIVRSIQKQEGVLKKVYDSAMASAVEANFSRRKLRGIEQAMASATKKLVENQRHIAELGQVIAKKGLDDRLKDQAKALQEELKLRQKAIKEEAKERLETARKAAKESQKELSKEKVRAERRAKGMDWLKKGAKAGGGFGKGIRDLISQVGSGDVQGVASTFGKGGAAVKKGLGAWAKSGRAGSGVAGGFLKGIGKLGAFLSKLGVALAAVAAIAAAFAILIKVFLDADKVVKDMNASLLKSNTVSADLVGTWGDLEGKLTEVRDGFTKWAFMNQWKVLPKEAMQVVDAWGAAGVKLSQFTDGLETAEQRQQKLRNVTEAALTYSNLLGMSAADVASKMGEYMDNLGQSLDTVRTSFSGIYRVAAESGYATKKFFGMVLQATSGLTMYNVRLEQTASMLDDLTKTLGLKEGFEVLQKILGSFKGKSMTAHIKGMTIRQGSGDDNQSSGDDNQSLPKIRATLRRDAEYQAGNFLKALERRGVGSVFEGAAGAAGIRLDFSSVNALLKGLEGLTQGQFETLLVQLDLRAVTQEQTAQVRAFQDIFQVLIKGIRAGDAFGYAGAEKATSPVYKMIALFQTLEQAGKLTGMSLSDLHGKALAAAESLGEDAETAQNLAKQFTRYKSHLETMQRLAEEVNQGKRSFGSISPQEYAKQLGLGLKMIGGEAKVVTARPGLFEGDIKWGKNPIQTFEDLLYANEDLLSEMAKKTEDPNLLQAQAIAANTNEATKILGAIKDGILNDIFVGVMAILNKLLKDKGGAATRSIQDQLMKAMDAIRADLKDVDAERATLREMLPRATGEDRTRYQSALTQLDKDAQAYGEALNDIRGRMLRVSDISAKFPELWEEIVTELADAQSWHGDWWELEEKAKDKIFRMIIGQDSGADLPSDVRDLLRKGGFTTKEGTAGFDRVSGVYGRVDTEKIGQRTIHTRTGSRTEDITKETAKIVANTHAGVQQSKEVRKVVEAEHKALRKTMKTEVPDANAAAMSRSQVLETALTNALANTRGGARMSGAGRGDLAKALRSGSFTPHMWQDLIGDPAFVKEVLGLEGFFPPGVAETIRTATRIEDGLIRIGRNRMEVMRIREDDIIRAGTPSGPLSRAGGGGAKTVTNNFWEGKSAFASLRDYERAKGQYK